MLTISMISMMYQMFIYTVLFAGIAVQGSTLDTDVVKAAVSKPTENYYQYYRSHYELEHNTRDHYHLKCS